MTALVKGHIVKERAAPAGRRFSVAAAVVCWEGGLVGLAAGVAKPAAADATLTIVGMAMATADNRTGLAGAVKVDVRRGVFLVDNDPADPVTAADIGADVYVTDDHTVAKTSASASKPKAGTLFDVDASGGVWLEIR